MGLIQSLIVSKPTVSHHLAGCLQHVSGKDISTKSTRAKVRPATHYCSWLSVTCRREQSSCRNLSQGAGMAPGGFTKAPAPCFQQPTDTQAPATS